MELCDTMKCEGAREAKRSEKTAVAPPDINAAVCLQRLRETQTSTGFGSDVARRLAALPFRSVGRPEITPIGRSTRKPIQILASRFGSSSSSVQFRSVPFCSVSIWRRWSVLVQARLSINM